MFYNFTGFLTLTKREIKRFMKVYVQTILAPLLSNLLFLGIFGATFKTRSVSLDGVSYMEFLIPGLCLMGAVMSAIQNPSSSIIIQKFQNIITDLNSYPLSLNEKILAYTLGGTFRGLIVGVLTYLASIPFIGYEISHPVLFISSLTLISAIFSLLGIIIGLVFENFDRVTFIISIILTPLIYFGGVFFEISKLPEKIANIAFLNPIFPLVDTVRYAFLGVSEGKIMVNVFFVIFILLICYASAYSVMSKGVGLKN
jgi:ABC-2 type transport system permease protein